MISKIVLPIWWKPGFMNCDGCLLILYLLSINTLDWLNSCIYIKSVVELQSIVILLMFVCLEAAVEPVNNWQSSANAQLEDSTDLNHVGGAQVDGQLLSTVNSAAGPTHISQHGKLSFALFLLRQQAMVAVNKSLCDCLLPFLVASSTLSFIFSCIGWFARLYYL